jgi:hypothetical protein
MLQGAKNAHLYRAHLALVQADSARTAYLYLIGWSSTLSGYDCFPSGHGDVPDYRFYRVKSWDFAFIPAQSWLLFYFRKPCQTIAKYEPVLVTRAIPGAAINPKGEVTVRVDSLALAETIARYIERDHPHQADL